MISSVGGRIVNIASIPGKIGTSNSFAYIASKHGVVGLTEAAAFGIYQLENSSQFNWARLYHHAITHNYLDDNTMKALTGMHPIDRLGAPEEVAELALFINSDQSSLITGAYYNVDGGYLAQ